MKQKTIYQQFNELRPDFIRMPKGSLCPLTGLSRAKLYELITPSEINNYKPPVESVSLLGKEKKKGTRLIVYKSLTDYLYSKVNK